MKYTLTPGFTATYKINVNGKWYRACLTGLTTTKLAVFEYREPPANGSYVPGVKNVWITKVEENNPKVRTIIDTLEDLVGETIWRTHFINEILHLTLADGRKFTLQAYKECCNTCWIEDVDNIEALQVATVKAVENLEVTSSKNRDGTTEVWGHRFITSAGICTVGMRNSYDTAAYVGELTITEVE